MIPTGGKHADPLTVNKVRNAEPSDQPPVQAEDLSTKDLMLGETRKPLVSVIIPTYNRRHQLKKSLDSVLGQSHRPIELIIVDDGSTDGTVETLDAVDYPIPVQFIRHEKNKGGSAARNTGIHVARGSFIAFLDSDDCWHPDKIKMQIELLCSLSDDYGVCYTGITRYDDSQNVINRSLPVFQGDMRRSLLQWNCVDTASCVVVRTDLLKEVFGFDETLKSCQDWDLWIRLSHHTLFAAVPDYLTNYVAAKSGRISTDLRSRMSGYLSVYRKHLRDEYKRDRYLKSEFYYVIADTLAELGRPRFAKRFMFESVIVNPTPRIRVVLFILLLCNIKEDKYKTMHEFLIRVRRRLNRLAGKDTGHQFG